MSASCVRCPNLNCRCEEVLCPTISYRIVLFFNQAFLNWINSPASFSAGTIIAIFSYRLESSGTIPVPNAPLVIGTVPITYQEMAQAFSTLGWEIKDLGLGGPFEAILKAQAVVISHVNIDSAVSMLPPFSINLPVNFSEIEECDPGGYRTCTN